jgi:transcriptional regulator with XRE-family HTH domain
MNRGAQRLAAWLEEGGVNQADLAERIAKLARAKKISQSTVSSWARGAHLPRAQYMMALREVCDIDVWDWTRPLEKRPRAPARARTGTDG